MNSPFCEHCKNDNKSELGDGGDRELGFLSSENKEIFYRFVRPCSTGNSNRRGAALSRTNREEAAAVGHEENLVDGGADLVRADVDELGREARRRHVRVGLRRQKLHVRDEGFLS